MPGCSDSEGSTIFPHSNGAKSEKANRGVRRRRKKDDFDQSECNFYISFLTSDDTNTVPPSFKDQVSYFPVLSRSPWITSVHLHISEHVGHMVAPREESFTIDCHIVNKHQRLPESR